MLTTLVSILSFFFFFRKKHFQIIAFSMYLMDSVKAKTNIYKSKKIDLAVVDNLFKVKRESKEKKKFKKPPILTK